MADRIAKLYRLVNGVLSSDDSEPFPNTGTVVVTISNGAGSGITRRDNGAQMLPADPTPLVPEAPGVWEYDHTSLNLDLAYDYDIWFRIEDTFSGAIDYQPVLIASDIDSDTLSNIRRKIGRLMLGSKFGFGPVTVADQTSVSAQFVRRRADDFFKGHNAFIVDGTGAGQEAFITGSLRSSGQLNIDPGWDVVPGTNAHVETWADGLSVEAVNDAINQAIADVSGVMFVRERTQIPALSFSADRHSLEIPAGYVYLSAFRWQRPQIPEWSEYTRHGEQYRFEPRDGRLYLNYQIPSDVTDGYVDGYRRVRRLRNDSDISDVPSAFLVFFAAFQLEAASAAGQQLDPEQHSGRAGNWLRQAMIERAELMTRWLPNTVEI